MGTEAGSSPYAGTLSWGNGPPQAPALGGLEDQLMVGLCVIPEGLAPRLGKSPRLFGATSASLSWICSDTFLGHRPLSQSLRTLEAQASFAVTPPTG